MALCVLTSRRKGGRALGGVRLVWCAGGALGLFFCSQAQAESVPYGSVPLAVDILAPLAGEQSKIVLGGDSFISSNRDAGRRVALLYLSKPKLLRQLGSPQVAELVIEAASTKDTEVAVAALGHAISAGVLSEQEFRSLVSRLKAVAEGGEILEQGLARGNEQTSGRTFCIALQYLEPARLVSFKDRAPLALYRHQFECTEHFRDRAQALLEGGDIEGAEQALDTVIAAFNDGSEQFVEIVSVRKKLEKLRIALQDGSVAEVGGAINAVFEGPLMRASKERIFPLIVDSLIDSLVMRGDVAKALEALPLIDFNRRTDRENEQLGRILAEVRPKDQAALSSPEVRSILRSFSQKSDFVRDEYLAALARVIAELTQRGDDELVEGLIGQLIEVRPDPSFDNDRHRLDWAWNLLGRGDPQRAQDVLKQVATGVPLLIRGRIALASVNWFLVTLFVGCVAILYGVVRGQRAVRTSKAAHRVDPRVSGSRQGRGPLGRKTVEDVEPEPRPFVAFGAPGRPEQRMDEYDKCLAIFGMKAGATLAQIKVAYRNAVKACHPDLNPNSTSHDTERFIELTQVYDRLLKLHAERTGER